jgi:outer membrane protein TolC
MKITYRVKKQVLTIAFLFVSLSTFSQKTLQLSLREAQEYAIDNNKNILNTRLSISEAQKRTWEAIALGLPQVNATVSYQNMMGFRMSFAGMDIPLQPTSDFQATVTQLLFNAGYWVGIKMSRIGEQMSATAAAQAILDVRQQTQSAYYAALVAEDNLKILEQNKGNIEILARNAENLVNVGVAEKTDADQLKLQVMMMANTIRTVERHIELAYNLLRFHLGVEIDTEIVLTQSLEDLLITNAMNELLDIQFNADNSYTMQLLDGQVEMANLQLDLAKMAVLPTVTAFYSHTYKIARSAFDMAPNNVIGMQASIPIFASGQRHVRTQQAKINLEKVQNDRTLVTESLLMQERQLRFNLKSAIESLELQKEAIEVSQRVFESVTRKFQQGTASSLDVTTANTNLLQTQSSYINAIMETLSAQTELEKLLNTL